MPVPAPQTITAGHRPNDHHVLLWRKDGKPDGAFRVVRLLNAGDNRSKRSRDRTMLWDVVDDLADARKWKFGQGSGSPSNSSDGC